MLLYQLAAAVALLPALDALADAFPALVFAAVAEVPALLEAVAAATALVFADDALPAALVALVLAWLAEVLAPD